MTQPVLGATNRSIVGREARTTRFGESITRLARCGLGLVRANLQPGDIAIDRIDRLAIADQLALLGCKFLPRQLGKRLFRKGTKLHPPTGNLLFRWLLGWLGNRLGDGFFGRFEWRVLKRLRQERG